MAGNATCLPSLTLGQFSDLENEDGTVSFDSYVEFLNAKKYTQDEIVEPSDSDVSENADIEKHEDILLWPAAVTISEESSTKKTIEATQSKKSKQLRPSKKKIT